MQRRASALDDREQLLFDGYRIEVDPSIDMAQVHAVNFAAELAAFDECTTVDKQKIFFELYAIALIDESFPKAEKILVTQAKERFNISDDKFAADAALKNFIDAYKNLRAVKRAADPWFLGAVTVRQIGNFFFGDKK